MEISLWGLGYLPFYKTYKKITAKLLNFLETIVLENEGWEN